jgi:hypothetical protein
MKYIIKILLLSLAAIPFFIWEGLVSVWTFRTANLVKLRSDVAYTIGTNYRKAFNISKSKGRTL